MRTRHLPLLIALFLTACDPTDDSSPTSAQLEPVNAGTNCLLITVDTLRADHLSSYGYPRPTSPEIDALASRGVLFERAFTYWPKTRGSFAAMFTGRYASQHGLTVRDRDLPAFNQTLAESFSDAGYRTGAALDNANLDAALGFSQGFDSYEQMWTESGTELERTERITRFGERFLAAKDEERPFFLWLHYVNPHAPYDPPPEVLGEFRGDGQVGRGAKLERVVGYHGGVNRKLAVEGEDFLGDYFDRYDAEIRVSDRHVGRILEALEQNGLTSTTLVVLTSDHGESLGEHDYYFDHGYNLFRPTLRIPMIFSFPGVLPASERVQSSVTTLDLYPSILDLTQISFPPGLTGRSVLPVVRGTKAQLHERLMFENDRHQIAISNSRVKLIDYPGGSETEAHFELYDLMRDPFETMDKYPQFQTRIESLKAELSSFRTKTIAWQQETTRRRGAKAALTDQDLSDAAKDNLIQNGYMGESQSQKRKP